ncbi:kinesin 4 [Artemisia annua]|uniref:Kinesin 4 n=1 Tax=Artemisia annua TaxID=35608 RepID=A0A2U1NUF9_ARTAN|nr:kinesin 4 [Artemisia annua]
MEIDISYNHLSGKEMGEVIAMTGDGVNEAYLESLLKYITLAQFSHLAANMSFVVLSLGALISDSMCLMFHSLERRQEGKRFVIYIKARVYEEYVMIKKEMWDIIIFCDGINQMIITGDGHLGGNVINTIIAGYLSTISTFQGQAKTLMFIHMSPELNAVGEKLSKLKFPERVATVELGNAQVHKDSSDVKDFKQQEFYNNGVIERKLFDLLLIVMSPARADSGCLFLHQVRANVEIHSIHLGRTGMDNRVNTFSSGPHTYNRRTRSNAQVQYSSGQPPPETIIDLIYGYTLSACYLSSKYVCDFVHAISFDYRKNYTLYVFVKDTDKNHVVLMGARTSRVENQDAIDDRNIQLSTDKLCRNVDRKRRIARPRMPVIGFKVKSYKVAVSKSKHADKKTKFLFTQRIEMIRMGNDVEYHHAGVASVMKVRSALNQASHAFFQNQGFVHVEVNSEEPISMDDTANVSLDTVKHSCVEKIKKVPSPSQKLTQRAKVSRHKDMANVFIVTPESLSSLFEGRLSILKDAQSCLEFGSSINYECWMVSSTVDKQKLGVLQKAYVIKIKK